MKWSNLTLKPPQHEMNGAMKLAQCLLADDRVDALSKYAINEHLANMQARTDILLQTKLEA